MRLLHRAPNQSDFSLVEYEGNEIPPYAILSHTWGPYNEEVTFEDIAKGKGDSKSGYRKLIFCSEKAAQDSLDFFWVDTCCIDKSSSTELSEAINSMFKWYQKAKKCYVFLSDVSYDTSVENISQEAWAQIFQKSRWFKRGWTLQELLAPASVELYSKDGDRIGDKTSLLQALQSTTQIPFSALRGAPLAQFTVDERLSWAKERETKREEDAVYSLLGIFDVHMPLIYGEGREKALLRLRREISEAFQDLASQGNSLSRLRKKIRKTLASRSPSIKVPSSQPLWTVPFRRDEDFVSRAMLDKVVRVCAQPAGRAALFGLGGVGKSQIAIEYAYQVREQSPTKSVFWVHAGSRARFEEGYRRIAETKKMNGWNDPKVNILRLVRSWLCDESNGHWTMVVDNADDLDLFFNSAYQNPSTSRQPVQLLSDFLPQSPNGSILITSRSQEVARKLTGSISSNFEVRPMSTSDALALLEKKLGYDAAKDEATRLVHALDSMPLALTQAAAFISQRAPRMSISRFVDEIERSHRDRARLLKQDVGDSRRDGQASNSIIATWQISFEYIRKQMPTAARLLSLMSMFDRQGIQESLIRDRYGNDKDEKFEFEDDIYTLSSFSLIEMSVDGREFKMHRLVQFSTKKWLELYDELETWKGIYAVLMDDSFPCGEYENWPVCHAMFPHAQALFNSRPEDTKALEAWASVLYRASWYLSKRGEYNKAHELVYTALTVQQKLFGAEHPATLDSLDSLGRVFERQGKYDEAEIVYRRAFEARQRVLGLEHADTLTSMGNLASSYRIQKRWKEAEDLEIQVLAMSRITLGEDHPDTLTSMDELAAIYSRQERWKEAEELGEQVLTKTKLKLGEDHPSTVTSMANLASTYAEQGRLEEAEELEVHVLKMTRRTLGDDHSDTMYGMYNLARTWRYLGRHGEAQNLMQECVQRRRRILGVDHPDTVKTSKCLSRWKAAERRFKIK